MQRIHVATVVVVLACSVAGAQSRSQGDAESCHSFVQEFYDWYVAHGTNFEAALKLRQSALSPKLRAALVADQKAASRNPDEIVGLDFDPFVNSQDPAPDYRVGKTALRQGTCWAQIHAVAAANKTSKPDAIAELRFETGNWKFVNFHYGSENGPANENLISILRRLSEDRRKGK